MTVDPVQDDIEIVSDGEGTDAFAVSIHYIIFKMFLSSCVYVSFVVQPMQNMMLVTSLSSRSYVNWWFRFPQADFPKCNIQISSIVWLPNPARSTLSCNLLLSHQGLTRHYLGTCIIYELVGASLFGNRSA